MPAPPPVTQEPSTPVIIEPALPPLNIEGDYVDLRGRKPDFSLSDFNLVDNALARNPFLVSVLSAPRARTAHQSTIYYTLHFYEPDSMGQYPQRQEVHAYNTHTEETILLFEIESQGIEIWLMWATCDYLIFEVMDMGVGWFLYKIDLANGEAEVIRELDGLNAMNTQPTIIAITDEEVMWTEGNGGEHYSPSTLHIHYLHSGTTRTLNDIFPENTLSGITVTEGIVTFATTIDGQICVYAFNLYTEDTQVLVPPMTNQRFYYAYSNGRYTAWHHQDSSLHVYDHAKDRFYSFEHFERVLTLYDEFVVFGSSSGIVGVDLLNQEKIDLIDGEYSFLRVTNSGYFLAVASDHLVLIGMPE